MNLVVQWFRALSLVVAAVVMVVFASLNSPAQAQDVKLATGNNYFPYSDERLPNGGLGPTIVEAVFNRMNLRADIDYVPWDEGYAATLAGNYVGTFPYIKTSERQQDFIFTDRLFTVRPQLFVNNQNAIFIQTSADLQGRTICVPQGWGLGSYMSQIVNQGGVNVYDQTNVVGCFKLMHEVKVDAIYVPRELGTAAARAISPDAWYTTKAFARGSNTNYMMVSKSLPGAEDFVARFNVALGELRDAGVINKLIDNYYDTLP